MLEQYLVETADLLSDSNNLYYSRVQLTRYVNQARRQVAYRSGCIRCLVSGQSPFGAGAQPGSLIPGGAQPGVLPGADADAEDSTPTNSFNTIAGVEQYPFAYANPYLRQQFSGVKAVVDVVTIAVSWGSIRPAINWIPFDDLQAYARSYNVGVTSYPFYWATNGDGETANLFLFPTPNSALEMEWDTLATPLDLFDDSAHEAIPDPFRDAVKYYAAFLAYLNSQRHALAKNMLDMCGETLQIGRTASERGRTPSYYW